MEVFLAVLCGMAALWLLWVSLLWIVSGGEIKMWPLTLMSQRAAPPDEDDAMVLAYEVIADDIRANPKAWTSDGYRLKNRKRGITIWIANKDYGISVSFDKERGTDWLPTAGGNRPPVKARKALWEAVKHRQASIIVDRFRDGGGA